MIKNVLKKQSGKNIFTYSYISGKHSVSTEPEFIVPPKIYKYFPIKDYNLEALDEGYLYASHPFELNDSLDSSDKIFDFTKINKNFSDNYYRYINNSVITDEELKRLWEINTNNNFRDIREVFYSSFSNHFGSISLTTKPMNILMWPHYTEEKGFCVEFDTDKLLSINKKNNDVKDYCLRPMQYVENIETIDFTEFYDERICFLYSNTVKLKQWDYEEEWRLTIFKNDMNIPFRRRYHDVLDHQGSSERKYFYERDCINSIILGKLFFFNDGIQIVENNTFIVRKFKLRKFINLLFDFYNDKLEICSEKIENNKIKKCTGKIKLEKINKSKFKIIDLQLINIFD